MARKSVGEIIGEILAGVWGLVAILGGAFLGAISMCLRRFMGFSCTADDGAIIALCAAVGAFAIGAIYLMLTILSNVPIQETSWPKISLLTRESWDRRRTQIKGRDKAICRYCGHYSPKGHVDHILPLSRGGTDDMANLVWTCPICNHSKGTKTLQEWQNG